MLKYLIFVKEKERVNMVINGLNKLTLLDYPGLTACTIYTGGCNFRCPFCHNAPLVIDRANQPVIPEEEIFAFLNKRKKVLDGVCVTGGEPTLDKGLADFIVKIREMGYKVKLDTNGSNPQVLNYLIKEKLIDYAAMDIKNSPGKYAKTIGVDIFNSSAIIKSAELLLYSNMPYEFRTTVVSEFHDGESFKAIGEWLKGGRAYYLQHFIDSGNLIGKNLHPCTKGQMTAFLNIVSPYFKISELRGID